MAVVDSPAASINARALWIVGPRVADLRDEHIAPPRDDEVLVRTICSGISRGTESLVFGGRVPVSEQARMRAPFQAGQFPFPVKYGYCSVGVVEAGVPALVGRTVFVLHPHQDIYVVPASAAMLIPVEIPPARAVLTANMETAINGLWDGDLGVGDRVCVLGAGVVGCLIAYLAARVPGCEVELCDVDPRKAEVAERLGVRMVSPPEASGGCDRVFEATGVAAGLQHALDLCAPDGSVVAMSWYGDAEIALPLGRSFHAGRIRIISSQVGRLPGCKQPRWSHSRRLDLALRLLDDPALDVLLTGVTAFEDLAGAMGKILEPSHFVLCHRVVYS